MLPPMRSILAFSLLLLTACGDEEEQGICAGEAQYEFLQGNWVNTFTAGRSSYQHKLRLTFGDPNKEEASVTYSCADVNGDVASVSLDVGYVEHSPEQISIGQTGNMRPRERGIQCEPLNFGGRRYNLEYSGECIGLNAGNGKVYFQKGL